jgi:hypothetical protein
MACFKSCAGLTLLFGLLAAAGLSDAYIATLLNPSLAFACFLHGAVVMLYALENWGLLRDLESASELKDKVRIQADLICQLMTADRLVPCCVKRKHRVVLGSLSRTQSVPLSVHRVQFDDIAYCI